MKERFTEIVSTQRIRDNVTGYEYHGLVENGFIDEINKIYNENKILKEKKQATEKLVSRIEDYITDIRLINER